MFRVARLQSALDELTEIWVQADSAVRQGITSASPNYSPQSTLRAQRNAEEVKELRKGKAARARPTLCFSLCDRKFLPLSSLCSLYY